MGNSQGQYNNGQFPQPGANDFPAMGNMGNFNGQFGSMNIAGGNDQGTKPYNNQNQGYNGQNQGYNQWNQPNNQGQTADGMYNNWEDEYNYDNTTAQTEGYDNNTEYKNQAPTTNQTQNTNTTAANKKTNKKNNKKEEKPPRPKKKKKKKKS